MLRRVVLSSFYKNKAVFFASFSCPEFQQVQSELLKMKSSDKAFLHKLAEASTREDLLRVMNTRSGNKFLQDVGCHDLWRELPGSLIMPPNMTWDTLKQGTQILEQKRSGKNPSDSNSRIAFKG